MGACKAPAGARVIQGAPVGAPWGPHGAPCWFQNVVRGLPGPYWSPLGGVASMGVPWGPYGREVPRARALLGMMRPAPHVPQVAGRCNARRLHFLQGNAEVPVLEKPTGELDGVPCHSF